MVDDPTTVSRKALVDYEARMIPVLEQLRDNRQKREEYAALLVKSESTDHLQSELASLVLDVLRGVAHPPRPALRRVLLAMYDYLIQEGTELRKAAEKEERLHGPTEEYPSILPPPDCAFGQGLDDDV